MTPFSRRLRCRLLGATLLALLAAGCTPAQDAGGADAGGAGAQAPAPKADLPKPVAPDRPFYRGTPAMRRDILDLFARVEGAPAQVWADTARKLVAYGEPAVPLMVQHLESGSPDVQVMAAYCLGMIQDPRALPALKRATASPDEKVRHEAATSMLRMGDRGGLPPMIDALEHADPLVRARAILVLRDMTGETLGYRADDKPVDREAAVARWRAWLARTGGAIREGR